MIRANLDRKSILIVVNDPKAWPLQIPGVEVIDARTYLTDAEYGQRRGAKVFNLCRSYRYQSTGYYVTLLASARGHRPLPSISTIQDMRTQSIVRFVSDDLDKLIQSSLARVQSDKFVLSIYFGRNFAKRYERLATHLFNLFQAPLLRAYFTRNGRWQLRRIGAIPVGEIPEPHRPFLLDVATRYFTGRGPNIPRRRRFKYDLAILTNELDSTPPSDSKALGRFIKAAEHVSLRPEIISPDDFARIGEFDALFVRETTQVNHHTYRFARRGTAEGLVVIDDPESIVRCTNKVYLAELLSRQGISIPKTLVVHRDNIDQVEQVLGFPCVLKQPDSSFSRGVVKVKNVDELHAALGEWLQESDLVIAQEFISTPFDWRIGVMDRTPIYACRYFMARDHWQIYKTKHDGKSIAGKADTLPVELAPRHVVRTALRAANLIGDGLYGVDVKEIGGKAYLIEVNDNPSIDAGVEDSVLKDELYRRVMSSFLHRIDRLKAEAIYP
jgi:glutathione synthase/RimK-type ligase-like ATP-grasp enzyme